MSSSDLLDNDKFDEEKLVKNREAIIPVEDGTGTLCELCYFEYRKEDFFALECRHEFCMSC